MWLENKRKSGGGQLRDVEYDAVNGTALVSFQDDASKNEIGLLSYFVIFRHFASAVHAASSMSSV